MNLSFAHLASAGSKFQELAEREQYEDSLIEFAAYVWPVVEPAIPFIRGWAIEAIAAHLEAVSYGHIRRLLINVPPGFSKSLLTDVFWPAWEWGPLNRPHLRYVCASYSNHLTERDNMRCRNIVTSERYKRLWGSRFGISNEQFTKIKFANNKTGWKLATSVGGIGVGERGDRFIVDDGNNTMEMESETTRNTTNMWFTEVVPDRLNNQQVSAIVVIQQRLHEDDISGVAISREMGYTHLMIPMEHDVARHCTTVLGVDDDGNKVKWEDPRVENGELAWPERFPEEICRELERDKGPYAWCSTGEAPVLMADLGMRPISEIKKGDKILGFTIGDNKKRARLKPAEVLSISVSFRSVVRITLASGEIIRCTPDHKWWTGRNDKTHLPYAPARKGSTLSRVCLPWLPDLSREDVRLAGWLGGFFDGEGSVSLNERRKGENSPLVSFTQGAGRNLSLCEKLEFALTKLGFSWSYWEKKSQLSGADHKVRQYWLKMSEAGRASRLPLYQRFLHVVQPTKWKDRLIEATTNGRLYTQGEKVISVEPDGFETVYGLETTTGNYVVWGLASSNSGQYQQTPEPRGGSIIKREFWQLWEEDRYPAFDYLIASLDTAYTTKEENDPSALTIWGVFKERESNNTKVMLVWAWQGRMEFHDLVEEVSITCTKTQISDEKKEKRGNRPRFEVDVLLIEAKSAGLSVGQELYRLFSNSGKFGIHFPNMNRGKYTQDKVARVHSIQHMFSDRMVYAPDRMFADMVINQMAVFPKSSHDDLVDTTSQALRYLRDSGILVRREEQAIDEEAELAYKPRQQALYLPYR